MDNVEDYTQDKDGGTSWGVWYPLDQWPNNDEARLGLWWIGGTWSRLASKSAIGAKLGPFEPDRRSGLNQLRTPDCGGEHMYFDAWRTKLDSLQHEKSESEAHRGKLETIHCNYFVEDLPADEPKSMPCHPQADYSDLYWAMQLAETGEDGRNRGNQALASPSKKPRWMNKPEFLSFASIRAFPHLQDRKVCLALRDGSLPLEHVSWALSSFCTT